MTDLTPDTTVWHIPRAKTKSRESQVHTNESCNQLAKAEMVLGPKQFGDLHKEWGLCDYCAENVETGSGDPSLYLRLASEDFRPEKGQSIAEFREEIES